MDFGGPGFIIAIIAVSTLAWLINTWIRAKHGYDLEDEWGGKTSPRNTREVEELRAENAKLVALLENQGQRMETLERIVTDKGYRLSEEIEALRDTPPARDPSNDAGVPIETRAREHG